MEFEEKLCGRIGSNTVVTESGLKQLAGELSEADIIIRDDDGSKMIVGTVIDAEYDDDEQCVHYTGNVDEKYMDEVREK